VEVFMQLFLAALLAACATGPTGPEHTQVDHPAVSLGTPLAVALSLEARADGGHAVVWQLDVVRGDDRLALEAVRMASGEPCGARLSLVLDGEDSSLALADAATSCTGGGLPWRDELFAIPLLLLAEPAGAHWWKDERGGSAADCVESSWLTESTQAGERPREICYVQGEASAWPAEVWIDGQAVQSPEWLELDDGAIPSTVRVERPGVDPVAFTLSTR